MKHSLKPKVWYLKVRVCFGERYRHVGEYRSKIRLQPDFDLHCLLNVLKSRLAAFGLIVISSHVLRSTQDLNIYIDLTNITLSKSDF